MAVDHLQLRMKPNTDKLCNIFSKFYLKSARQLSIRSPKSLTVSQNNSSIQRIAKLYLVRKTSTFSCEYETKTLKIFMLRLVLLFIYLDFLQLCWMNIKSCVKTIIMCININIVEVLKSRKLHLESARLVWRIEVSLTRELVSSLLSLCNFVTVSETWIRTLHSSHVLKNT